MAETGFQSDDTTQSFVVRTWQEPPGKLRGTVRHVQSQAQYNFTRVSQVQDFIEQHLARLGSAPLPANRPVAARSWQWIGMPRRRFVLAASALLVVVAAGTVVIASLDRPAMPLLGSAVGQATSFEVILALFVGLVLGSLGTALWLRRHE